MVCESVFGGVAASELVGETQKGGGGGQGSNIISICASLEDRKSYLNP